MSALLLLLLAAICCSRLHTADAAQESNVFDRASTDASSCACGRRVSVAARSDTECAILSNGDSTWRSFSFISGICTLSDNLNCASAGAPEVFRKQNGLSDSSALNLSALGLGCEQLVGDRRFWVFQQRKNGAVSFARNWTEYERGFGNLTAGEFWSGLLTLKSLTSRDNVTLRMEMKTLNGTLYVAEWSNFTVGDASTNYTMQYKQYLIASSNVSGDDLEMHKGMQFSTFDRDNDKSSGSCSLSWGSGGFWFNGCLSMTPNGLYSTTEMRSAAYMSFYRIYPDATFSTLREMRMMLQLA